MVATTSNDAHSANGYVWREWRRQTRFLESARLAFARERQLWHSLSLADPGKVELTAPAGPGKYSVALADHLAAIDDEEALYSSVLVQAYAFTESVACDHLGVDSRESGGIEDWGLRLLQDAGFDWTKPDGGLAGAVEVAVVRSAFAHGTRVIDVQAERRLLAAGMTTRPASSPVHLPYDDLRKYRMRLRPPAFQQHRSEAPRQPSPLRRSPPLRLDTEGNHYRTVRREQHESANLPVGQQLRTQPRPAPMVTTAALRT